MGLFENFPYTNFHELNLMWILDALKKIQTTTEQFVAINSLKYADPIQWDITSQYEKNTIVIDPQSGTAFISVQPVPVGVILTNTDYWTVVFDLERFVTKANNNFTLRVEEQTTLTATFPTPENGWVVWAGVLYKANTNIIAGDQYVVDSNISRITVEDVIGHIEDLKTAAKDNVVNAINELFDSLDQVYTNIGELNDLTTADKTSIVNAINSVLVEVGNTIGDLDDLNTTDKISIVNAINDVLTTIGDLNDLTTTDKTSIVNALNEVAAQVLGKIGDLDNLTTTDKDTLVDAINEVNNNIDNLSENLNNALVLEDSLISQRVYVDGVSGSDDNVGTDNLHPFKTLDKAFEMIEKGYTALRITIMSAGTYSTQMLNISNISLHIHAQVSGITISFENPTFNPTIYNSYVHLESVVHDTIDDYLKIRCLSGLPLYLDHCSLYTNYVNFDTDCRVNYGGVRLNYTWAHYYNIKMCNAYIDHCGCIKLDAAETSFYMTSGILRITGDFVTDTTISGTPTGYCFDCASSLVDVRAILTDVISKYSTPFNSDSCLITGRTDRLEGLLDGESRAPVAIAMGTKPNYTIDMSGLIVNYVYFTRLLDGNAKIKFSVKLPDDLSGAYSVRTLLTLHNLRVVRTAHGVAVTPDSEMQFCQLSSTTGYLRLRCSAAEAGKNFLGELIFSELYPTTINVAP